MTGQSRTFRLRGGLVAAVSALTAFVACEPSSGEYVKPRPPVAQSTGTTATPVAAPATTEPDSTTASFGDWVMRCQRGEDAGKAIRICEVAQTIQAQGQSQPLAQIAVGRVGARDSLDVTVILPPNITLPTTVRIVGDEKDTNGFELAWRRCLPGGCVAQATARDDALKRWRVSGKPGRIMFKNAAGQDIAIPLSFRGLGRALDALAKETP